MALQFTEREFIPVLLGGDINAYSVARAFYEEYQVKSLVFGKYQTGPAYRSQIIDYTPNVDIDTMPVMLKTVNGIAQAHADKTIVLVGCGDNYVALVAQAKDAHELADNIVAPYASLQHARAVPEEGDLLRAVREAWRALSAHVYLYQGDAQCPG